jgi:diguanylate cyclase (GGDEF)-like protein
MTMTRAPYLTLIQRGSARRVVSPPSSAPDPIIARFPGASSQARDPLCDVAARQGLLERLELVGSLAPSAPLSFIVAKIHGLDELNRTRGFAAGDAALKGIAATISRYTRATDLVGRFTGSSFGVVLQGTGATGAAAVAARLSHYIAELSCIGGPVSVTVAAATGRGLNAEVLPMAAIDSLSAESEAR